MNNEPGNPFLGRIGRNSAKADSAEISPLAINIRMLNERIDADISRFDRSACPVIERRAARVSKRLFRVYQLLVIVL